MAQKSLGLIETVGLPAAIVAADAAVKSANVELVGYELTRGGGAVAVKVEGEVGAVKAAVEAAQAAVSNVSQVVSVKVIARPSTEIEHLIRNADTVGYDVVKPPSSRTAKPAAVKAPATAPAIKKPAAPAKPPRKAAPAPVKPQAKEPAAPAKTEVKKTAERNKQAAKPEQNEQ